MALALLVVIWTPSRSLTQDLDGLQHPPDIRWQSIDAPHYEVIFPRELAGDAQRVANTLERVYEPDARTLQVRPRRTPARRT